VEYYALWETCLYYKDFVENTESKWKINPTKLQMDFYLDILQAFTTSNENVLRIYTRAKFMLATKITNFNYT